MVALVSTLFLANKLGNLNYAKFLWPENFSNQGTKADWSNTQMRNYNGSTIIGASCEPKESFFSDEFIKRFFIEKLDDSVTYRKLSLDRCKTFEELKQDFFSGSWTFFTLINGGIGYFKDINIKEYRQGLAKAFTQIDFAPRIKEVIKQVKNIAKDLGEYYVIHVRSGDIGFYAPFRCLVDGYSLYHWTYSELALAIIEANPDKKFVVVGDDITALNELVNTVNRTNVICVDSLRDTSSMSNLELFFFDIILMSETKKLYGSKNSGVLQMSLIVNPDLEYINSYEVFPKQKQYELAQINYKRLNLSPWQKALSLCHLFYLANDLNQNEEVRMKYLDEALNLDPENDKYRIYKLDILMNTDIKKAEKYAEEILLTRKDEFLKLICIVIWGWRVVFYRFFNRYFCSISSENPNLTYIAAKIMQFLGRIESVLYYNIALQGNKNLNDETFNLNEKHKDFLLSLASQGKYLDAKDYGLNRINLSYLNSAKARIHRHLSYKLGAAMIRNSKSLFGYLKMPYILIALAMAHQEEQNSKLACEKLPPLQTYSDYSEALKEKECFTYKLGLAITKATKTWFKGGYLKFFFKDLPKLKAEFKVKKKKQNSK